MPNGSNQSEAGAEALRKRGMKTIVETERPASACFDWLALQADVDADRIGMMALSLGGYYSSLNTSWGLPTDS